MAGANKIIKNGDLLFKAGDKSDGMYVIRKGELQVFLEQDGKQVVLATIPEGSIVGEMAFFDSKPRSASIKANKETEVTLISNADFSKLLKQIPKWFVSLMEALSGRLRTTNERLQKLEGIKSAQSSPLFTSLKLMNILVLHWSKNGNKDDRSWTLDRENLNAVVSDVFGESPEKMGKILEALATQKIIGVGKDKFGKNGLTAPSLSVLERFVAFASEWSKKNPKEVSFSQQALDILEALQKIVTASAYDAVTASLTDLKKAGESTGCRTFDWGDHLRFFKSQGDAVLLTKSGASEAGLRTTKKEIAAFIQNHKVLAAVGRAKVE